MRKLYLVLISSVVVAVVLAYQATYLNKQTTEIINSQSENDYVPVEQPIPVTSQENVVPSNTAIQDTEPEYYERRSHIVDGQQLILLQIYKTNSPEERKIVELKNSEYMPLDQKYRWVEKYINTEVTDFWFMKESSQLYLLRFKAEEFRSDSPDFSELVLIDYSDLNDIKSSVVETFKNGIYESKSFAGFNPNENSFVIVTGGGDGCGGWGDIFTYNLETKVINMLKDIGSGCSHEERYFKFDNGKLILGKTVDCTKPSPFDGDVCLSEIYALNPFNLSDRNTIRSFTKPYQYDAGYLYGKGSPRLMDKEIVLFKGYINEDADGYNDSRIIETYIYNIDTGQERMVDDQ